MAIARTVSELRYENHVTAAISLALPTFRQRKRNVGLSHQTLFPSPLRARPLVEKEAGLRDYQLTSLSSIFESILTAACFFWEIHNAFCTRPFFSTGSPISRSFRSISRYSREQSGCSRGRSRTILMILKLTVTVHVCIKHGVAIYPGNDDKIIPERVASGWG